MVFCFVSLLRQKHHSVEDALCKTHAAPECAELDHKQQQNCRKKSIHHLIILFPVGGQGLCTCSCLAVLTESSICKAYFTLPSTHQQHKQDTQRACHTTKHAGLVRGCPRTKFKVPAMPGDTASFLACVVLSQPHLQVT